MEIRWTNLVKNEEVTQNMKIMNEITMINLSVQNSLQRAIVKIFRDIIN